MLTDRLRLRHPQDRAVRLLAGHAKQPWPERRQYE
jgi:hypothetical protein